MSLMRIALFLLACLLAADATAGGRVFIAGDSTASEYPAERAPQEGWGMRLQPWLADGWEVRNHAQSGRSTRSFIEEGWLDGIAKDLRAGDVLLIQFGHNDAKAEDATRYVDPAVAYPQWLMRYVALAREHGATPVLVTPVARRIFDGKYLVDTHGLYPQAVRTLAQREGVALIDLWASSTDWVRGLGAQASRPYFMHVPAQGKADDTHFSRAGAEAVACLVAAGWRTADPAAPVKPASFDDCTAIQPHVLPAVSPSVVVHERDIALAQPGPLDGEGDITPYPFFGDATGLGLAFRKRVLQPGAGIEAHARDRDEIYYVQSGRGELTLNGEAREVGPGDAILVRAGDSHALQQRGEEALVLFDVVSAGPASR